MGYYFSKTVRMPFAKAVDHVTKALAAKGFGILTTVDIRAVMKDRLGYDFRPYVILGACNPHFAWRALQAEDKIGAMLPCNVVVSETATGSVEIAAVDPVASMMAVDNPELAHVAEGVRAQLREVVRGL
jgi:uncharacterized protein (DUF302 family)